MSSVKVYSAIFSRRSRESSTFSSHLFAPQALGSSPISGPLFVLCNPNLPHHPNPFLPSVLAVLALTRDIMSPKSGRPLFSFHPQGSASTAFPGPLFRPRSRFFGPESKPLSSFTFRNFTHQHFLLSWLVDSIFIDRSTFKSDVTDKRKPFERMGRKTSDLSNGSWVTQVTSGLFLAHSFEGKNGLFVYGPSYRGGQL